MTGRLAALRRHVGAFASAMPRTAVDVVIAALCCLCTIISGLRMAMVRHELSELLVLGAAASFPLIWRRRRPVAVAAAVGAGTLGLAVAGPMQYVQLPYGQLVATYTVAALAAPLWRLATMACTTAGVLWAMMFVLHNRPMYLVTTALLFIVGYTLGTGARARRDRIALLEERALRLAAGQQAMIATERTRIAREIHDIVAHSVSIMVIQAEAGLVVAGDPHRAAATFETISDTGRETLAQLGRALGVLRGAQPGRRPQPSLGELPDLVERARLAGLEPALTEHGTPRPVSSDLAAAVYRLVQEAITNTVKHADARRVSVDLHWRTDALRVQVTDDGRGPSVTPPTPGHGLIGMRERVQAFGGRLRVGLGDGGRGFRTVALLPLPAPVLPSGERTDEERTDEERTNGERTNGERTNGERTAGERTAGERTDGERTGR